MKIFLIQNQLTSGSRKSNGSPYGKLLHKRLHCIRWQLTAGKPTHLSKSDHFLVDLFQFLCKKLHGVRFSYLA